MFSRVSCPLLAHVGQLSSFVFLPFRLPKRIRVISNETGRTWTNFASVKLLVTDRPTLSEVSFFLDRPSRETRLPASWELRFLLKSSNASRERARYRLPRHAVGNMLSGKVNRLAKTTTTIPADFTQVFPRIRSYFSFVSIYESSATTRISQVRSRTPSRCLEKKGSHHVLSRFPRRNSRFHWPGRISLTGNRITGSR